MPAGTSVSEVFDELRTSYDVPRSIGAQWVAGRELAAAIDNPVVTIDGRVESNGNFHGAPVGYVLDFLAIAAADVASMSERRTDRFLDASRRFWPTTRGSTPGT